MKSILTPGLLLAVLLAGAPTRPLNGQGAPRVVAVGDIHGAIAEFKSILKTTGLADDTGRWSGGKAVLLQTGDYMDRGAGTRAVLDLLMALERQAKDAGGRVVAMLGNHEVMNLIGDTRDVTPEIFATFADAQSESRRQAAWEQYAKLAPAKAAKGEAVPAVYQQTRGRVARRPTRRATSNTARRSARAGSTAPGFAASRSSPYTPARSSCTRASRRAWRRRSSTI